MSAPDASTTPHHPDGAGRSRRRPGSTPAVPADPGGAPRSKRRGADTRERLLRAGLELLARRPELKVVGLTANAVSERAGVTSGAFFHHFSTQAGYFEALVSYITTNVVVEANIDAAYQALADVLADGGSLDDGARALGATDLAALGGHDPAWPLAVLLFASGPERASALRAYYDVVNPYSEPQFQAAIAFIGRKPRPPMSAIVPEFMADLTLGSATRRDIEPEAIPADLFAAVYAALLAMLLRPVGDERTLFDLPAILGRSILGDASAPARGSADNR